jgi:serine phosphatase RsbU (regulator of sigma subunit)
MFKGVVDNGVLSRLQRVERVYDGRFSARVESSNRYRKVLYAWSLVLLAGVIGAGVQLRRVYAELERRVADRTSELRQALSALWGEMRLARKIQEALVPAAPALFGCEVAALMKATDQVGGDYYDVVQTPSAEWILIGDVSGHGVPAGLVMMMCHTAVRTVLAADPKVMPHTLLARVNTVLSENMRQLGENKYMTISALRRNPDGSIHFAGAHQDILVYRAASDSIETRETQGIWLGLKPDIASALTTKSFQLTRGDVLLLYTDGVTEAARDGALFDAAGVKGVLSGARGKSAREVLDALFAALRDFDVKDDATALVIRQVAAVQAARPAPQSTCAMVEV